MEKRILFYENDLEREELPNQSLVEFAQKLEAPLEFNFQQGQYWLKSNRAMEKPIGVDVDAELRRHEAYFKSHSLQKELLARAIGIKPGKRPFVLDLTGGLLGDSLLMLSMGCRVVTVERNPMIAFLIESALKNASHSLLTDFQFHSMEALNALQKFTDVETIFFDPMFEDLHQKSIPQKEMRIFRELLGGDHDSEEVLKACFKTSADRVVVKRPRLSRFLGLTPQVEYKGKSTRYDVYFPKNMAHLS